MWKPSSLLVINLATLVAIGAVQRAIAADSSGTVSIVLNLHDRASVFSAVLDRATKEANRIYRHAGVQVLWVNRATRGGVAIGGEDRSALRDAFTVEVIILPRNRATAAAPAGAAFLMGAAESTSRTCGGAAYVFYDHVQEVAHVQQVELARVLGSVIAHEVGHLLTQQRGHSPEGLLRAPWNVHDWELAVQGLLLFSSSDSSRMHATLLACNQSV